MSSYELIVMALGCCVSGSTAAVHTGDAFSSAGVQIPLEAILSFNSFFYHALYSEGTNALEN